jgi:hypothetical protein
MGILAVGEYDVIRAALGNVRRQRLSRLEWRAHGIHRVQKEEGIQIEDADPLAFRVQVDHRIVIGKKDRVARGVLLEPLQDYQILTPFITTRPERAHKAVPGSQRPCLTESERRRQSQDGYRHAEH